MTWRIQKLFSIAAIAAALLINSLPAKPESVDRPAQAAASVPKKAKTAKVAKKVEPSSKLCLDELIGVLVSRKAA